MNEKDKVIFEKALKVLSETPERFKRERIYEALENIDSTVTIAQELRKQMQDNSYDTYGS